MKKVAVIGGGITGLSAAFKLQRSDIEVTLFEASDRVGGVIQTVRESSYLAECGPNTLMETAPEIGQLILDLGIEDHRIYSDPAAEDKFILRDGKPVPLPTSVGAFLTTKLFSFRAKLRLFLEPFIRRGSKDKEENLAEFVKRRIGQEFLDYAINPFVAGVYAGDPARLSVKHAFPKLLEIEQRFGSLIKGQILGARERKKSGTVSKQNAKKLSFDSGLQFLIDSLQEKFGGSIRLNSPVASVIEREGHWQIITNGSAEDFDAVLFALPAFQVARLGVDLGLGELSEIRYPPVASVVFGFRREDVGHSLNGFGTLIPEVENFHILGSIFSSSLFPGRAPEGHVTISSYIGGTRAPDLARLPEDEIYEITFQDLKKIYDIKGEPTFRHCFVHSRAIPQYEVGYGKFRDQMDRAEEKFEGLFLAGHCRDGISLSDSIVSSQKAARRIEAYISE